MSQTHSLSSFKTEKSNFVLHKLEDKIDRVNQREMLLKVYNFINKTPKRLIYKTHSGQLINTIESPFYKTEYSHKFSMSDIQEIQITEPIKEEPLEISDQNIIFDTLDSTDKPQMTSEQLEQSILDLQIQFPNFSLIKDKEGAFSINKQTIQTKTCYQQQFQLPQNENVNLLNQHQQPAWTLLEEYSPSKNNLKMQTTFQNDYKNVLLGPIKLRTARQNKNAKYDFIGSTSYQNQFLNWGSQKQERIQELYNPATLPGVLLKNNTSYRDQFKIMEHFNYQKTKKMKSNYKISNVSLGSLPFLPRYVQDFNQQKKQKQQITFEDPQKKSLEIKPDFKYRSEPKKEIPKSIDQIKKMLQMTLTKMD